MQIYLKIQTKHTHFNHIKMVSTDLSERCQKTGPYLCVPVEWLLK